MSAQEERNVFTQLEKVFTPPAVSNIHALIRHLAIEHPDSQKAIKYHLDVFMESIKREDICYAGALVGMVIEILIFFDSLEKHPDVMNPQMTVQQLMELYFKKRAN